MSKVRRSEIEYFTLEIEALKNACQRNFVLDSITGNLTKMKEAGFLKKDRGCFVLNPAKIQTLSIKPVLIPVLVPRGNFLGDGFDMVHLPVSCKKVFGGEDYGLTAVRDNNRGGKDHIPLGHFMVSIMSGGEWTTNEQGLLVKDWGILGLVFTGIQVLVHALALLPALLFNKKQEENSGRMFGFCDKHKPGCCIPCSTSSDTALLKKCNKKNSINEAFKKVQQKEQY